MKNFELLQNVILCLMVMFCVFSCSNDIENIGEQVQYELEEYEPYISPQMQEILAMIDTCTTPIPIQTLIPGISSLMSNTSDKETFLSSQSVVSSNVEEATIVVTGYHDYTTLYVDVETYVDAAWASNMNLSLGAGTYTVTCASATYWLKTDGAQIL